MGSCVSLFEAMPADIRDMASAIVESNSFQRLGKVSFLGAIDRMSAGSSSGSRLDHSLGVAEIMCSICDHMSLSAGELRIAVANALLHDIGHGPYSHSSEPFFSAVFSLDHHIALQTIIENEDSEVSRLLKRFGLWIDYRRFVRDPWSIPAVCGLYYSSINVDTIEGIMRAAKFFNIDTSLDRSALIGSLAREHVQVRQLDLFWDLKSSVYNEHIFATHYAICDEAFTRTLNLFRSRIRGDHFFLNDEEFEAELGREFEDVLAAQREKEPSLRRVRTFKINKRTVPRQFNKLDERYNEVKGRNEGREHNR